MPKRKIPITTGEFYHIYNRGLTDVSMFSSKALNARAVSTVAYYQFSDRNTKFSDFIQQNITDQHALWDQRIDHSKKLVDILAYTLMPNHFHFLVREKTESGVGKFISSFASSYTQFYNRSHNRRGPIFEGRFKAKLINSDTHLLHISRYIHLNPYSSGLINSYNELLRYPWSSFHVYRGHLNKRTQKNQEDHLNSYLKWSHFPHFVDTSYVLSYFRHPIEYITYVLKRAEYQRHLKELVRPSLRLNKN